MTTRLKCQVTFEPQLTVVKLVGSLDEHVNEALADLRPQIRTPLVCFDCEEIALINSIGAATWMAHLRGYQGVQMSFVRCPTVFTSLCLVVPDLIGHGKINSLFVGYHCATCDEGSLELIERTQVQSQEKQQKAAKTLPPRACRHCRQPMAVDPENADFVEIFTA